jgi:uracil-DNA glycosylase family 4
MQTPETFLTELLRTTKECFEQSPIYKKQQNCSCQWSYSACATPIQRKKVILIGINWGVSGNHSPQTQMPTGEDIKTYTFIQRSRKYLEQYFGLQFDPPNFNYTNLCFFRTPRQKDLHRKDYEMSLPLFMEFVKYVEPNLILSLGNTNTQILECFKKLTNINKHYDSQRKHYGVKASLDVFPYISVPHPNAHVLTQSREEIWQKIGQDILIPKCE